MAKKKTLKESEVAKLYEVVIGFNDSTGRRFDVGKQKPNFVTEKNFKPEDWKSLIEMGALIPVETVEAREDEVVVFEVIK